MDILEVDRTTFGHAWLHLLSYLVEKGQAVSPRGKAIREIPNVSLHVRNGLANVLWCPIRNPSYRFMVAEWLWIWFGRDDVASIVQYNPKIAEFSDDGVTFSSAYGPRIKTQWLRVQNLLEVDPDTRQAVIQIYHPPLAQTKDVACTLSVQFLLRQKKLHVIVNMRSSDIWLGLPYDFYNFSMLGNIMAAARGVELGTVTFHLGSSHLYEVNLEKANEILRKEEVGCYTSPALRESPPLWLGGVLIHKERYMAPLAGAAPWPHYAHVLMAEDNMTAFRYMESARVARSLI